MTQVYCTHVLYMSYTHVFFYLHVQCRYEQQLEDLQAKQSNIVSELHKRQEVSEKMKSEVHVTEANLQEAEFKKQAVRHSYIHVHL